MTHRGCARIQIHGRIHFDLNQAVIRPESHGLLDQVASLLEAHPEVKRVRVEGHTDDRGGDALNLPLSEARAQAVRDYLVGKGVEPARLEAKGYGSSRPLVPTAQPGAETQNRRVEFIIVEPAEEAAP